MCLNKIKKQLNINNVDKHYFKKHNIIFIDYKVNDEKIKYLNNYCGIHLCPSLKEGYGHYINESRITKSVVITVDGKPMNELISNETGYLLPSEITLESKYNYSLCYSFKPIDLYKIINKILKTDELELIKKGELGFYNYLSDTEFFINNIIKVRNI